MFPVLPITSARNASLTSTLTDKAIPPACAPKRWAPKEKRPPHPASAAAQHYMDFMNVRSRACPGKQRKRSIQPEAAFPPKPQPPPVARAAEASVPATLVGQREIRFEVNDVFETAQRR
uniref:Uncharacterized protein n=1 Tax=Knipowitschia caucasica TaxID=637954 RepID=A0AAV2JB87_KNICA